VVLKFGSSVLETPASLPIAVAEIYRHYRNGRRIIAVVSAFAGVTDSLWATAKRFGADPDPRSLAALLATGENATAVQLGLALERAGVPAQVADPREFELTASGDRLDATPITALVPKLSNLLAKGAVLVVPGFFARHIEGGLALLGRGGSDLTALYLAAQLKARCILVKDVDGLYESDPADKGAAPRQFAEADYASAEACAGPLIQLKALRLAHKENVPLQISRPGSVPGTLIRAGAVRYAPTATARRPIRVALLGLGTVGGGVLDYLDQFPESFRVVAAFVRRLGKHSARLPEALITTSLDDVFKRSPEIVIEALPDLEPARIALKRSLYHEARIVTANKALLAETWPVLEPHLRGQTIRFSGAVGGSVPMVEAVLRLRAEPKISRLRAVLNGTSNFVLDRCAAGDLLMNGVRRAQAEGLAEADPTEDLSGRDAARKIEILGNLAFGGVPICRERTEISERVLHAHDAPADTRLRLIAEACRSRDGFNYRITLERLPVSDFLAGARGAENRLEIFTGDDKVHRLSGLGAGRVPTATAVFADVLDHAEAIAREGVVTHDREASLVTLG
jgi:homoserine dehydrogenase